MVVFQRSADQCPGRGVAGGIRDTQTGPGRCQVQRPLTGPANWKIACPAFVIAMAAVGVASYYLLKRLDK
ncbi:MAG: hypothetical protein ACM3ZC_08915 [Bacteroidota bacterium]